jgi:ElaB/YqjD/DUF883 family membrane-anchored ribosome-binding protein
LGTSERPTGEAGGDTATPAQLPQTKAEIHARREDIRQALVELEDVLSRPAGDHDSWTERVRAGVEHMHTTLQHHVRETEAEGGMLAQLEEDAPWLEGRVEQLRRDHDQLLRAADDLLANCRAGHGADELREDALELLRGISRHRHQGTDLLYDAYMVDISAAD